jgi:NADPH2:quinone reductase
LCEICVAVGLFLQVKPWPIRALGAGDVQVAVEVCGMNFADLYTRQGLLRDLQLPLVLGMECAGEVTAVGDAVEHIKVSRMLIMMFVTRKL